MDGFEGAKGSLAEAMRGSFDGVEEFRLHGWAKRGAKPVKFHVKIDNEDLGIAESNEPRTDLTAAGLGPVAFWFDIPSKFCDGNTHKVELNDDQTLEPILGTPVRLTIPRALGAHATDRPPSSGEGAAISDGSAASQVAGSFDGFHEGRAFGWVHAAGAPPLRLSVDIDGQNEGFIVASLPREDLRTSGLADCAFEFQIPKRYRDGEVHLLEIEAEGGGFAYTGDFVVEPDRASQSRNDRSRPVEAQKVFQLQKRDTVAISVVLPTFNRADLFEGTARNLLTTIADDPIELVVIDDGSGDGTPDVLGTLAMEFPKLRHERIKNGGPGNARNIGAEMARGDIIMFVGDDTRATTNDLFRAHYQAHRYNDGRGHAVLGKIIWPDDRLAPPNFVMNMIQGDGQQQFGYKFLKPWQSYNHWIFYTANVSVKSKIVDDWTKEGFDRDFTLAAFEDAEFAYRMSKRYSDFGIYYTPNAVVEHHHPYDVAGFMRRQVSCGMMLDVMLRKHPELGPDILGPQLSSILAEKEPAQTTRLPGHQYSTIIEGIRSWALVLDSHYGLGSQNWHQDFLNSVFRLALFDGFLMVQQCDAAVQAKAYRYLIEDFRASMGRAVSTEVLGEMQGFGLI